MGEVYIIGHSGRKYTVEEFNESYRRVQAYAKEQKAKQVKGKEDGGKSNRNHREDQDDGNQVGHR